MIRLVLACFLIFACTPAFGQQPTILRPFIPEVALQNSGVAAGSYTNSNITVNPQGFVTAATNGSGAAGACFPGAVCLTPAGGGAGSDNTQFNQAFNDGTKRPIILLPTASGNGTFDVCNMPHLPQARILTGPGAEASLTSTPAGFSTPPVVVVQCSGSITGDGHYTGLIRVDSGDLISGFGMNTPSDCLELINATDVTIHHMWFQTCATAINQVSDPSDLGLSGNSWAQESDIHNNNFTQVGVAWTCNTVNSGSGCTDNHFTNNEIEVPSFAGVLCLNGCGVSHVLNNRFEDGNVGIVLDNTNQYMNIIGNFCNNLTICIELDGGNAVNLVGNRSQSFTQANSICWALSGQQTFVTFQGNQCALDKIAGNGSAGSAFIYCPTLTFYVGGGTCSTTTGGVIGLSLIDDLQDQLQSIGGSWAAYFANGVTANYLGPATRYSRGFTQVPLASGQNGNMLAGCGWGAYCASAFNVTYTPGAANDPIMGMPFASTLTENNANTQHAVTVGTLPIATAGQTFTIGALVSPSGTTGRYFSMPLFDSTGTNIAGGFWDVGTTTTGSCAFAGNFTAGSGAVYNAGAQKFNNSWCLVWANVTTGIADNNSGTGFYLSSGTTSASRSYLGNSSSSFTIAYPFITPGAHTP